LRILVTGAGGFTGRHFVEAARAAGHTPVALAADLRDRDALAAEVAEVRPEAVVHLAGIAFVAHTDERAFYDVNLFGTLHLLDALAGVSGLRRVLLASSANVYGNSGKSPLAESEPLAPVSHYAASKAAMESLSWARASELPLVVARPFNYTGPGQSTAFVIPKLIDHFRRRASTVPLGNLDVEREYNDVRLVCEAYLRLLDPGVASGTYNVCTGVTYDLSTVLKLLERMTGHHVEVEVDPALVRPNEIRRLCGSPARLHAAVGELPAPLLERTLSWMLEDGR
jgi:nucleoside-diphosphate-sugar epimerase